MVDVLDRPKRYVTPGTTDEEVARRQRRLDSMVSDIVMPRKPALYALKEPKPPMMVDEFYGKLFSKAKELPIWSKRIWGAVAGVAVSAVAIGLSVMSGMRDSAPENSSLLAVGYGSIPQASFVDDITPVPVTIAQEPMQLSAKWQKIYDRAMDGHAQSQKDVAIAMLDGAHGFKKDFAEGSRLLNEAAINGNRQALIDREYLSFYGKKGFEAEPQKALIVMSTLATDSKVAARFTNEWKAVLKIT